MIPSKGLRQNSDKKELKTILAINSKTTDSGDITALTTASAFIALPMHWP